MPLPLSAVVKQISCLSEIARRENASSDAAGPKFPAGQESKRLPVDCGRGDSAAAPARICMR
jgi:hypothetical protein